MPSPSYDLIHVTLARFVASEPIQPPEQQAYQAHWRPFSTPLRALALVRELLDPSLEIEDVAATTF